MGFSQQMQALRRKSGLTPEQLSAELGATRRELAAWEAGRALPDAERILTLARLFDVSLDELLDIQSVDPDESERGGLTAAQLRAMGELLAVEQIARRQSGRRLLLGGGAALLLAALALLGLDQRAGRLERELVLLRGQLYETDGAVDERLGAMAGRLEEALSRQGAVAVDWNYEILAVDLAKEELRLRLSALPRRLAEGARVLFIAEGPDFPARAVQASADGETGAVTGELTLPLSDEIKLLARIESPEGSESQWLGDLVGLRSDAGMDATAQFTGEIGTDEGAVTFNGRIDGSLYFETGGLADVAPQSAALILMRDGEAVETLPVALPPVETADGEGEGTFGGLARRLDAATVLRERLDCAPGQTAELVLEVADTRGNTLRTLVFRYRLNERGEPEAVDEALWSTAL